MQREGKLILHYAQVKLKLICVAIHNLEVDFKNITIK